MAVDKELLERDLYGLLGIGEKASEKEVRGAGGSGRAPSLLSPPCPGVPGSGAFPARRALLSSAELRGCSKRCFGTGAVKPGKARFY